MLQLSSRLSSAWLGSDSSGEKARRSLVGWRTEAGAEARVPGHSGLAPRDAGSQGGRAARAASGQARGAHPLRSAGRRGW
jgi:hypothetical protein